jgi:hypothetical protein
MRDVRQFLASCPWPCIRAVSGTRPQSVLAGPCPRRPARAYVQLRRSARGDWRVARAGVERRPPTTERRDGGRHQILKVRIWPGRLPESPSWHASAPLPPARGAQRRRRRDDPGPAPFARRRATVRQWPSWPRCRPNPAGRPSRSSPPSPTSACPPPGRPCSRARRTAPPRGSGQSARQVIYRVVTHGMSVLAEPAPCWCSLSRRSAIQ